VASLVARCHVLLGQPRVKAQRARTISSALTIATLALSQYRTQGGCAQDMVPGEAPAASSTEATSPFARLAQGIWARRPGSASCAGSPSSMDSKTCGKKGNELHAAAQRLMEARGGQGAPGGGAGAACGAGGVTTFGMSLPFFKMFLQLLLTGLNVVCWLVPMKIKRFRENQEMISMANAFSGGVFLSLAFGHMIPHAVEGFETASFAHNIPFFVTLAGYLLIFFVEKIAFDTHALTDNHHEHHHALPALPPADIAEKTALTNGAVPEKSTVSNSRLVTPPASPPPTASGRSALVLLLALAVHSIFETMALGLSDTPLQAGLLATSIALHQPAESIALLVAFLKSGLTEQQTTRYLSLFSAVGFLGVVLGLAVSSWASAVWDSVFVALTAGTFVYVGCTEIVAEEFEEGTHKWRKFGALLAGVLIVGGITTLTEGWEH